MRNPLCRNDAARHLVVVNAPWIVSMSSGRRLEELPKFIPRRCGTSIELMTRTSLTGGNQMAATKKGFSISSFKFPGAESRGGTMSNGFMSGMVSFERRSQEETEVTLKIRSISIPKSLAQGGGVSEQFQTTG